MREVDQQPLLSILIPAYRYGEGVHRILACLHPLPPAGCEVLVFDDSPDDEVETVVERWSAATGMPVTYHRHRPARGAPANWNALLDAARGKFCLLLHHDEFPLGSHFAKSVMTILGQQPDADVLMLDCVLVGPRSGQVRRHLPIWLRSFVVRRIPGYLLRRNVIGPTSALVIRRSMYPRFDVRLRWLVDVDAYVRLFTVTNRLKVCPQIQIGSLIGRSGSITAGLGSSTSRTEAEEQAYLRRLHPAGSRWLPSGADAHVWNALISAIEVVCWNAMRGLTRMVTLLHPPPVPRSTVLQALNAHRQTPGQSHLPHDHR